jgi:hypothetical protein
LCYESNIYLKLIVIKANLLIRRKLTEQKNVYWKVEARKTFDIGWDLVYVKALGEWLEVGINVNDYCCFQIPWKVPVTVPSALNLILLISFRSFESRIKRVTSLGSD